MAHSETVLITNAFRHLYILAWPIRKGLCFVSRLRKERGLPVHVQG